MIDRETVINILIVILIVLGCSLFGYAYNTDVGLQGGCGFGCCVSALYLFVDG